MKHTSPLNFGELWSALKPDQPCPAQPHSPTSRAAAKSIEPSAATLRAKVLEAIRTHGGLTDEQGMILTGIGPSTYRPRRVELVEAVLVRDSGKTKPTASGRQAVVWEAIP